MATPRRTLRTTEFASPEESIGEAIRQNDHPRVAEARDRLIGRVLRNFHSSPLQVELVFDGNVSLVIRPTKRGAAVRFVVTTDPQALAGAPIPGKLPDAADVHSPSGEVLVHAWPAFTELNRRIGLTCNYLFYNGEWLFVYWKGADITAFLGRHDPSADRVTLYWFDTI